jgi:hypothetical protein
MLTSETARLLIALLRIVERGPRSERAHRLSSVDSRNTLLP